MGLKVGTKNNLGSIGALQVMAKKIVSDAYMMNFYRDERVITIPSLSPTYVEWTRVLEAFFPILSFFSPAILALGGYSVRMRDGSW